MQQPKEPHFQGHNPTTMLDTSEHHRLQGLVLLSPSHPATGNCTTGELTLHIPDFPWNQNDNEFENELSNMAALLKPDELDLDLLCCCFN